MQSFIIVGYVWQILGRGEIFDPPPHPIRKQPWKNPSWIGLDFVTVGSWGSFPSKSFYGLFTWATFSFFLKKLQTNEANYPSSSIHLTLKPLIKSDLKYFTFQSVSLYVLFLDLNLHNQKCVENKKTCWEQRCYHWC